MTANIGQVAVNAAVVSAVKEAQLPVDNYTKQVVVDRVVESVAPVVDHLTNNEPWYRSRVTWGAIGAIALPLLGFVGVGSDVISMDEFVTGGLAVGTMASGLLTLYGRWTAQKPIGA